MITPGGSTACEFVLSKNTFLPYQPANPIHPPAVKFDESVLEREAVL